MTAKMTKEQPPQKPTKNFNDFWAKVPSKKDSKPYTAMPVKTP